MAAQPSPTSIRQNQLDPTDAAAFMTRGNALAEKGDLDRAIADYTEVIRLSPAYAYAFFNRALVYRRRAIARLFHFSRVATSGRPPFLIPVGEASNGH